MSESGANLPLSELYQQITEARVNDPGIIHRRALARKKRTELTRDGRLAIVAADHPGRGVIKAGTDSRAMSDRVSYLDRIRRVLMRPEIDGVLATPDIAEELLILDHLQVEAGQASFLDERVIVGSMNRGGLSGTVFEMRDRFTAFSVEGIERLELEGAKMMIRIDPENPDSGATLYECSQVLSALARAGIAAFLEPLPVEKTGAGYQVRRNAEDFLRLIPVATALGDSTAHLWLKIPYMSEYPLVCRATTCPILMLGGEARGDQRQVFEEFAAGLAAGPNVRGLLVGRNVLFPPQGSPENVAGALGRLVHDRIGVDEAMEMARR